MKYVNCGCGKKYCKSSEWINIDFIKYSEDVIKCNLVKGLPFKDKSIDAVYSCCMLEHFTKQQAENHIKECSRILKQGGIIRIVVPDLENVCREYLDILNKAKQDDSYNKKYEYIVIELIDQMSRTESGGEMQKYWDRPDRDEEYILERTGYPEKENDGRMQFTLWVRLAYRYVTRKLFGKFDWYRNWRTGDFINSGENHKWMYDSYSLTNLLIRYGFSSIRLLNANESKIENWKKFHLEVNREGTSYKPNCIYIEGKK